MTIRMGVMGLGMMGRHHGRILQKLDGVEFIGAVDPMGDQHGVIRSAPVFQHIGDLLNAEPDAVIVAVPTYRHHEAAMRLREAGVHTLIEKPIAENSRDASEIVEAFAGSDLVAAVGHVERCNPALVELRRRLLEGQLGSLYSISTVRTGPFPARIADVGVAKDLATHDIDIIRWIAGEFTEVHAVTSHRMGRPHEDLIVGIGRAGDNVAASMQVSWISPKKERTVTVIGDRGALVADLLMSDLTFFENGEASSEWEEIRHMRGVTEGDVTRYAFPKREPILVELERFRDAVSGGPTDELVSLQDGLQILRIAERLIGDGT